MSERKKMCLVSACLTGLCTRYDGQSKANQACLQQLNHYHWVPICPEQLGGLPTPRLAAELVDGDGHAVLAGKAKVIDCSGQDLSPWFIQGAQMVLTIAKAQNISTCFLKSRSPSCGLHPQPGVTAALLLENGLEVIQY